MINDFKNIILIIEQLNNRDNKKIAMKEEINDLHEWVDDLLETSGEFEIKMQTVNLENVCNAALFLFEGRSLLLDYDVCFAHSRRLLRKYITYFNVKSEVLNKKLTTIDVIDNDLRDISKQLKQFLTKIKTLNKIQHNLLVSEKLINFFIEEVKTISSLMKKMTKKLKVINSSSDDHIIQCLIFLHSTILTCEMKCCDLINFTEKIISKLNLSECD